LKALTLGLDHVTGVVDENLRQDDKGEEEEYEADLLAHFEIEGSLKADN
jgi:hypothetical protein